MSTEPRDNMLSLLLSLRDAWRGDVRAREEVYHLRGVLRFVGIFAVTVLLPGLMLAWYGIEGVRAEQRAGTAEVGRAAELAANGASVEVERYFRTFEDSTLNRLKSGESISTSLPELSDNLRVVFRFDANGTLAGPFSREDPPPLEDQELLLFSAFQDAFQASLRGEHARAAQLYGRAAREARGERATGQAIFARANELSAANEPGSAEVLYREVFQQYGDVRDIYGFRLGDLARLKLGEMLLTRNPVEGQAALAQLVEELAGGNWVIGRGGEAAVARRALDLLAARADPDWLARTRIRITERSAQLYQAQRLADDLDTLGAKGRLLKVTAGEFSYFRTPLALWAITWTDSDQYFLALDLRNLISNIRMLADRSTGPESDVRVDIASPDNTLGADVLTRRSLSRWLLGYSLVVRPRNPELLAERQAEQLERGRGIIVISVLMIGIGALLSARLLQRELESAREKVDFAAMVSHELRSPLTQIRVKSEALMLGLVSEEEAKNRHYEVIMREAERLSRMVDNILDFAAIRRGLKKYQMKPGDLSQTVIRAVESAQVSMELRGISIELELPDDLPPVDHDPEAIAQALSNLLSNAAKYGQAAGWIGVRVLVVNEEVWVEVADRGIGIAPEEQRLIFTQYYRSNDPEARRRKGTGLGLTIVNYIIRAHGGRASVRSTPGKGATFTLHFPAKPLDSV